MVLPATKDRRGAAKASFVNERSPDMMVMLKGRCEGEEARKEKKALENSRKQRTKKEKRVTYAFCSDVQKWLINSGLVATYTDPRRLAQKSQKCGSWDHSVMMGVFAVSNNIILRGPS